MQTKSHISRLFFRSIARIALFFGLLVFIFVGCKKESDTNSPSEAAINQKLKDKAEVASQIKQFGRSVTVPLNQRMEFYYGDSLGNKIPRPRGYGQISVNGTAVNSFTSGCDGDPDGYANINSYTLYTDCVSGYKVSFNTTVSTDDQIVAVNPFNSSKTTVGSVRVYNPSGTLVYSNLALGLDASTNPPIDLGQDPSNPTGYHLVNATFTSGWITSSVFDPIGNSYYTQKLGGYYMSDCSDYEHSNGGLWTQTYTNYQFPNADPLSRIDQIFLVTSSSPFNFYGEDATGSCTMSSYTMPDLQEINYSINGGTTWVGETASSTLSYIGATAVVPITNLVNGSGGGHYGYVDPDGVLELSLTLSGHGTLWVRHRNLVYSPAITSGNNYPIPSVGTNCNAGSWSTISVYTY